MRRLAWPFAGTAGIAVAVLAALALAGDGAAWRPATCMPADCFCEGIRPGMVRQPANAASGLAFVLVALAVAALPSDPSRGNPLAARRGYSLIYAAAVLVVGLGTTAYHASLSFWGQTVDVLGMYLAATFLLLWAATRLRPVGITAAATAYLLANAVLLALLLFLPALRRPIFALLLAGFLVLEAVARRRSVVRARAAPLLGAVGLLAAGSLAWVLDRAHLACAPGSLLQGHALWHLCGAGAAWLAYHYLRSEERTIPG